MTINQTAKAGNMTSAAALASYDSACMGGASWEAAAHDLASFLRQKAVARAPKALGFDMTAEGLGRALKMVCRAVERRSTIPILGHVLVEGLGDVLTLRATNMDQEIWARVEAPGIGRWSATTEALPLLKLLGTGKGPLHITCDKGPLITQKRAGGDLTFYCPTMTLSGAVSATLKGHAVEDFPKMADALSPVQVKVDAAALADMLAFVTPAISSEETRYYLNGAFIHAQNGRLSVVATDGHRLNLIGCATPADLKGAIIPRDAVASMLAVLDVPGAMEFAISANQVRLGKGPVVITSKLVDGSFPDYWRVVPATDRGTWAEFNAADMLGAIKRVTATANVKEAKVNLTFASGRVTLSHKPDAADALSHAIDCDRAGEDIELSFSARYLREAVTSVGSTRVKLLLGSPNDPARMESADKGADGRLCVLMPCRI